MPSRSGPRAKVNPAELVAFLDARSDTRAGGTPNRIRKFINNTVVSETDARMIRRWRAGTIQGVTESSARALLRRHNINPREFNV